jgi:hypothetical protein
MARLKRRHREILNAIRSLGGRATTRQIAIATGLHVNGVSQSLGALSGNGYVSGINVRPRAGGEQEWKINAKIPALA